MRNYLFITILAIVSLANQAFTYPVEPKSTCRFDSTSYAFLNGDVHERIELDLINRTWVETMEMIEENGTHRVFDFNEIGIVTITTTFENQSQKIQNMVWRLAKENGQTFLVMTNTATDESTSYEVAETCAGLELTDVVLNKQLNLIVK